MTVMSTTASESRGADEALVRARLRELTTLATRLGVTELRFASPGRLVGHVGHVGHVE